MTDLPQSTKRKCPNCDTTVAAGLGFCGSCGHVMPTATAAKKHPQSVQRTSTPTATKVAEKPVTAAPVAAERELVRLDWPAAIPAPPRSPRADEAVAESPVAAAEGLSTVVSSDTATVDPEREQGRRGAVTVPRFKHNPLVWAAALTGCLVSVVVVGVVVAQVAGMVIAAPESPDPVVKAVTLPFWERTADWSVDVGSDDVSVTPGGDFVGTLSAKGAVRILDSRTGENVADGVSIDGIGAKLYPVTLSGGGALMSFAPGKAWLWTVDDKEAHIVDVPEESSIAIRGGVPFLIDGTAVSELTVDGATEVKAPIAGAAVLSADDGNVYWASARGEVLTATRAGVLDSTVGLVGPVEGATLSKWVGFQHGFTFTSWAMPDGSNVLAVNSAADGKSTGYIPISGDPAKLRVLVNQANTLASIGPALVDLETGQPSVPDASFQATAATSAGFLGTTAKNGALVDPEGSHPFDEKWTVEPVGGTADGGLLAISDGRVAEFERSK